MTPARASVALASVAHLGLAGVGPARAQSAGEGMDDFEPRTHESAAGPVAYRLHEPPRWTGPHRLLVMLHGCTQDAADLAAGTGMNDLADEGGFAVLYPEQSADAHPQRCWTWYERAQQAPDGPEVARLASLVGAVAADLGVEPGGTYVAGISAGGAMANVLAATHPEMFAGVGVHSGIAFGAADNLAGGLAAMQRGAPDAAALAADPRLRRLREGAGPERVLVVHGADDRVVSPVNGAQVAEQWAEVLDGRLSSAGGAGLEGPAEEVAEEGGRVVRVRRWRDPGGGDRVVHVVVEGLGHAWSGGGPGGTYVDPAGPAAARLLADLFGLLR